jgi:uncharacterized membrane protein
MEGFFVLLALVLIVSPFIALILSAMNASRIKSLQKQLEQQNAELREIKSRLHQAVPLPPKPAAAAPIVPAKTETEVVPAPARTAAAAPDTTPSWESETKPAAAVPALAAPATPTAPVPVPALQDSGVPPTTVSDNAVTPVPAKPPSPPVPPRAPRPKEPPPPPRPAFNWEALLGVRGAAWGGGIAFVIAGILFAKWSFEHNLITPPMRVAIIVATGIASLVGSEFTLRKGYGVTANALSGAGILLLYTGFYVAHAFYDLLPTMVSFGLMAAVTVTACLLAIRYDAMFIAVLGLLGGFATPLLLSTGENRPIGLFSYVFLLDIGLLAVAVRKGWNVLALLSLGATLLMQALWFGKFMKPDQMPVAAAIFVLFAVLYLALPTVARKPEEKALLRGAAIGGLAPFLFAFYLAGNDRYAAEWPILFGLVACLDITLLVAAIGRGQTFLSPLGAAATATTVLLWASQNLARENAWGASLSVLGLAALFNVAPRFAVRSDATRRAILDSGGLVAAAGLAILAGILVGKDLGEPPWIFLVLLSGFVAAVFERSRPEWLGAAVPALGIGAAAVLTQYWFLESTHGDTVPRNLGIPLLLAVVASIAAAVRRARAGTPKAVADGHEIGAVAASSIAVGGLFLALESADLSSTPWPLFAALALHLGVVVAVVLRAGWTWWLPFGLVAAAGYATLWQAQYLHPADGLEMLVWSAGFYLAFLALPFVMPGRLAPAWPWRPWPWVASGLAGPLFFYAIYRPVTMLWGKAWIGLLPVLMAGLTVAALAEVRRRFASPDDMAGRLRRLRGLALFAAVALGFIALAIPLQLDRQWITIGWALEAAAVWWLYRGLPHTGLKYFGAILFAAVGIRLLANTEVLRYEPRGMPVLNWILYTYGVSAVCCLVGAAFLRPVERERFLPGERRTFFRDGIIGLAPCAAFLGLILLFALINLEIADFFSPGDHLEIRWERESARDTTTSIAWGVYALTLLGTGMARKTKSLRFISLGFMLLTVGKVFLYDLASLTGLYRILSFLGLAVALIAVSLLYQRFVFRRIPGATGPGTGEPGETGT